MGLFAPLFLLFNHTNKLLMIIDYKRIDLFGKMLFERAVIKPPIKRPNPMNNEACFLHIRQGKYNSISEDEFLSAIKRQSVLMKCGNFLGQILPDKQTGLYEAVAVHFHPDVLRKIYMNNLPKFLTKPKKNPIATNMVLMEASIPVDKYVEDVLFYFENPHLVNEEILILKTKEIILLLMQTQNAPNVLQILENLFEERTVDFKTTIESHLFSDITLIELAQLTNRSLSSFKRKFKATYHSPPLQYIHSRRLQKSKELLAISEQSIGDIAFDCGFKTINHFSKKFKESFGVSPSLYRKTLSGK
ncbi:AraC family transcriptional regulator [Flagellimonas aquimarina]|uniref:AraC family transcriptional regulator n=2 Tax=Flagellimonas aquimarina TaxID=2201895 RepID=A0A316L344_9FLAO|nr:AraC family transcriptional regulator [Allomuricauda koreensis]